MPSPLASQGMHRRTVELGVELRLMAMYFSWVADFPGSVSLSSPSFSPVVFTVLVELSSQLGY